MKFGKDLAVGIFTAYSLLTSGRHDISPSTTLEYYVSNNEWQISFDLGYSYSF